MSVVLPPRILQRTELAALLPIAVAVILQTLLQQIAVDEARWREFAITLGRTAFAALILVVMQIAVVRFSGWRAACAGGLGFLGYGIVLAQFGGRAHLVESWLLAFGCCTLSWGQYLKPATRLRFPFLPWSFPRLSLDSALILLLAGWALTMASLFASSPDPMANMPLAMAADSAQLTQRPMALLGYLLQFGVLAAILYAYFWVIRYQLIRKVLRNNGLPAFLFGSLAFVALSAPVAATLVLQLPLNSLELSLLPSENQNPFDEMNIRFVFILWLLITPVVLTVERLRNEALATQTHHQKIQAELRLLQQQINPHFLFNTLNSLYAMCLQNAPDTADMLIKLANLLRYAVYQGQQPFVALRQEMSYLQDYLSLQMLRVSNRCRLNCEWPETVVDFQLPPLLLIMLVENAFKHGVESSSGPCDVHVRLSIVAGRLHFVCSNTLGEAAAPAGDQAANGIGLENLRRRLQLLYGKHFVLRSEPAQGRWRAELQVDLRGEPY